MLFSPTLSRLICTYGLLFQPNVTKPVLVRRLLGIFEYPNVVPLRSVGVVDGEG